MSSALEREAGFTLIEILVVITVIAILAGLVSPLVFRNVGDAKTTAAKAQIESFADRWAGMAAAVRIAASAEQALTSGEKRRIVDAFLQEFPDVNPRELSRRLGVSHVYIWQRRLKLMYKRAT